MKDKIIGWLNARKEQFLMLCDDVHQMLTEGDEELVDRFGIKAVRLMWAVIITASFSGVLALLSIIF